VQERKHGVRDARLNTVLLPLQGLRLQEKHGINLHVNQRQQLFGFNIREFASRRFSDECMFCVPLLLSLELKTGLVLLLTISMRNVFFLLVLKRNASMADKPSDLVQGTLDMLILKTLALESIHGYGIAVRLEQMSKGVFRLNAGSLFVAFQRLQRAGLIKGEWKATENSRRAKYYVLTIQGRKRLNSETREWERQVAAIASILEAS
jgi:PadR family transcriptional regulator, regulatory protein PadR